MAHWGHVAVIFGRTALVLFITIVIAAAPFFSASVGISRSNGPAYAAVSAAPSLQDDNATDGLDNDESENASSGVDNDEASDNVESVNAAGSNVLDLNSNAALASDNDNSSTGNDNGDFTTSSDNDIGNDNVATPIPVAAAATATPTVTPCLGPAQQIELTVPQGRVIFRNYANGQQLRVTLTRIDPAVQPVPAPPAGSARLGGPGGLVFSVTAGPCGGAAAPTVPVGASLSVQYTDAAAAGLNKASLRIVSLPPTNVWTAVPNQRNESQSQQPRNEVVAELGATGTFSVQTVSP
jgi:hypothetical protein